MRHHKTFLKIVNTVKLFTVFMRHLRVPHWRRCRAAMRLGINSQAFSSTLTIVDSFVFTNFYCWLLTYRSSSFGITNIFYLLFFVAWEVLPSISILHFLKITLQKHICGLFQNKFGCFPHSLLLTTGVG